MSAPEDRSAPESAQADRRTTGTRRRPPAEPLNTVMAVLVVDDAAGQAQVRNALAADEVELSCASTIEEALTLAAASAPDVVLADHRMVHGSETDLAYRMREVVSSDVPLVLLETESVVLGADDLERLGASAALSKPVDSIALRRLLVRLQSTTMQTEIGGLGELTVHGLAARVAEEIRHGLALAVTKGQDVSVPLGEGSELLASVWHAIGRMRATMVELSGGRVAFDESSEVPLITVTEAAYERAGTSSFEPFLQGHTVLVADDDPAVLWFFAGLLREAGARVIEAIDGKQALIAAYRETPDLILADILMPRLDGLGLCRALSRDPILDTVPVILLSWKEDFLERMRELRAGAKAYLRKEASGQQILAQVEDTLRSRLRLETQLKQAGEVRGRIQSVGIAVLLRTVASLRPDAAVSVRDPWSLFELTYHEGRLVEATQTAIDGSFVRGPQALRPLVGARGGRFIVTKAQTSKTYTGHLEGELAAAVEDIRATVDAVHGSELQKVSGVELEASVLNAFLRSSPPEARSVAEQLASGRAPSELIDTGEVDRELVESVLLAFARRAGIRAVHGLGGEDRVLVASAKRLEQYQFRREGERTSDSASLRWHSELEDAEQRSSPDLRRDFDRLLGSDEGQDVDALLRDATRTEAALAMQDLPTNDPPSAHVDNVRNGRRTVRSSAARDRPGVLGWSFVLVVLAVTMILAWRTYELRTMASAAHGPPAQETSAIPTQESSPAPVPARPATVAEVDQPELEALGLAPFAGALKSDLPDGLAVEAGQGALMVEADPSATDVIVYVDEREVGLAPVSLALAEGRHEIAFRVHDDVFYRFTYIHVGKTRVLSIP